MRRAIALGVITFVTVTAVMAIAYASFSTRYFYLHLSGESMVPTFQDGDRVIFEKSKKPAANELIVFGMPKAWAQEWQGERNPRFLKRIAAVEGDVLTWDGSTWARNGQAFSSLQAGACQQKPTEVVLKQGQYFVTGDTTVGRTLDSRETFCKGLPYLVEAKDVQSVGRVVKVL